VVKDAVVKDAVVKDAVVKDAVVKDAVVEVTANPEALSPPESANQNGEESQS
jgi:hypothetical protein